MHNHFKFLSILVCISVACDRNPEPTSNTNEAIDAANNPILIEDSGEYVLNPTSLPLEGRSRAVWTGSWFPHADGGTSIAMQKYDAATGQGDLATAWELADSRRLATVSWAGHCNGLAAAGVRTREPIRSVVYRGVTFSPADIKALLVELFQGAGRIIGGRCNGNNVTTNALGRFDSPACRDLNPGTFHIAITNFLGLHHLPVILDFQADAPVWNYPVVRYKIRSQEEISGTEAMRRLGASASAYSFNPASAFFVQVVIEIENVSGTVKVYSYILEGNSRGDIVGGEWVGSSKKDHPDFIWNAENPQPLNPYVNPAIVQAIYRQSY